MCEEIEFLHSEYKLHKILDGHAAMHPPQQSVYCHHNPMFQIYLQKQAPPQKNAKLHVIVSSLRYWGAFVSLVKSEIM